MRNRTLVTALAGMAVAFGGLTACGDDRAPATGAAAAVASTGRPDQQATGQTNPQADLIARADRAVRNFRNTKLFRVTTRADIGPDRLESDLTVERGGRQRGVLGNGTESGEFVDTGDRVYFKGDAGFWKWLDSLDPDASGEPGTFPYPGKWVILPPEMIESSPQLETEAVLDRVLRTWRGEPTAGEPETVDGVSAVPMTVGADKSFRYYVTTDGEPRLIKIEGQFFPGFTASYRFTEIPEDLSFIPPKSETVDLSTQL